MQPLGRRSLFGLAAVSVVAACSGGSSPGTRSSAGGPMTGAETIRYGDDPQQFVGLTRAVGAARGVVVVVHGGFWQARYDLSLGQPLAESLARAGWHAWNLEYRRVGNGGGRPATFDDVSAGIDALADSGLPTDRVVTLGHSAGGHLAVWAAARTGARVPVTAAISQAGVLDLAGGADLGGGAAQSLMGGPPDASWAAFDPMQQLPLSVPVRCVHGRADTIVPPGQSRSYVAAATAAGADAQLIETDGDHFTVIDPTSGAWARTLEVLEAL